MPEDFSIWPLVVLFVIFLGITGVIWLACIIARRYEKKTTTTNDADNGNFEIIGKDPHGWEDQGAWLCTMFPRKKTTCRLTLYRLVPKDKEISSVQMGQVVTVQNGQVIAHLNFEPEKKE